MFEFFSLGRSKNERHDVTGPQTQPPLQVKQLPGTQREMVRLTLHHACKRHGIPIAWLNAELFLRMGVDGGEIVCLQLTVQKWHDALMLYALALQKELQEGFQRFDHSANAARYEISWRFAQDCGCPHFSLPDAAFWTAPTAVAHVVPGAAVPQASYGPQEARAMVQPPLRVSSPAPTPQAQPKFDLPRTQMDDDDYASTGFAATQINDAL